MDEVAPASPSDAASGLKEAVSGAKDALPDSTSDAADSAANAAKSSNPFSGFFGGAPHSCACTKPLRMLFPQPSETSCTRAAGAKDKVDEEQGPAPQVTGIKADRPPAGELLAPARETTQGEAPELPAMSSSPANVPIDAKIGGQPACAPRSPCHTPRAPTAAALRTWSGRAAPDAAALLQRWSPSCRLWSCPSRGRSRTPSRTRRRRRAATPSAACLAARPTAVPVQQNGPVDALPP